MFRKSLSMMLAAVMVFTAFPAGVMAEETNQPETKETAEESSSEKAQEAEETNQPEPEETAGESSSEEAQEAKETDQPKTKETAEESSSEKAQEAEETNQPETKETAEENSSEKAQEAEETEESIADEPEDQNDEDVYYANPNEQRSSQGEAYAVFLYDELTFFRSNNTYSNNSYGTFTDINGNEYEGRVYCGFETAEYGKVSSVPWYEKRASIKSVKVADDQLISPKSMAYWFNDCERLSTFNCNGFDTSNVTNMRNMFSDCYRLTSLDLSGFDTSNVVSMEELFQGCVSVRLN